MRVNQTAFMVPGGLDDIPARELADQINAGKSDADRLCRMCSMPDYSAREIASQIDTGATDLETLRLSGVSAPLAAAIKKAIEDARA